MAPQHEPRTVRTETKNVVSETSLTSLRQAEKGERVIVNGIELTYRDSKYGTHGTWHTLGREGARHKHTVVEKSGLGTDAKAWDFYGYEYDEDGEPVRFSQGVTECRLPDREAIDSEMATLRELYDEDADRTERDNAVVGAEVVFGDRKQPLTVTRMYRSHKRTYLTLKGSRGGTYRLKHNDGGRNISIERVTTDALGNRERHGRGDTESFEVVSLPEPETAEEAAETAEALAEAEEEPDPDEVDGDDKELVTDGGSEEEYIEIRDLPREKTVSVPLEFSADDAAAMYGVSGESLPFTVERVFEYEGVIHAEGAAGGDVVEARWTPDGEDTRTNARGWILERIESASPEEIRENPIGTTLRDRES
jgi:hypothetical protein